MNYIVFDLEWNQGRDGKQGQKHEEIPFEIIEIGATKLDENRNVIGQFHQLIKPSVYKNMHYVTENMLHINMEDLKRGKSFCDVMEDFLSWCEEDYLFCTWGSLDLLELQRNMRYYNMEPLSDGPICFLDIQKLYSIAFEEDKKSRRALEYAIDALSVEKDIPFHRAFSDAYYTAKILQRIPKDIEEYCSYDVFHLPSDKESEIQKIFPSYAKYIFREFKDKSEAIVDRDVISTRCYICDKNARRKIKWFTSNGKHYYSISHCDKHGYMKGKIRIRKGFLTPSDSEQVYVIKTLKFISEEEMQDITEKREHARKQRQIKRKSSKQKNTKNS